MDTVDKPKVAAELKSDRKIAEEDKKKAEEAVTALFSLDYDLKPFYEMVKDDKIMTCLTRRLWGLKSPTTQPFLKCWWIQSLSIRFH